MMTIREALKQFSNLDPATCGAEGLTALGIGEVLRCLDCLSTTHTNTDIVADVKEFHVEAKMAYNGPPRKLPKELQGKIQHFREEYLEWMQALKSNDLVRQLDAMVDMIYVLIGIMEAQGLPFYSAWREIHNSNMTKEFVEMGQGKHGLSVNKGKRYQPPQLERLINESKSISS